MAIDKGLYAAPLGLADAAVAEPDLEIEIEDPESVKIGMDGVEIEIEKKILPQTEFVGVSVRRERRV